MQRMLRGSSCRSTLQAGNEVTEGIRITRCCFDDLALIGKEPIGEKRDKSSDGTAPRGKNYRRYVPARDLVPYIMVL